jgi:hypothetical protein
MKSCPRLSFLSLAFALAVLAPVALSAADDAKRSTTPEADRNVSKPTPGTISVDFPGGTIADLNTAIAKAGGMYFNLVGEKSELATAVPAFSIRNASPDAFAMALNQLLSARGLSVSAAGNMGGPNAVFVLAKGRAGHTEPTIFNSFQLGPYLEKQSVDDIVTAIRTLWELKPGNNSDALQLKFHPPTKLLLVSGSPEAITVASTVISNLAGPDKTSKEQYAPKR